MGRTLAVDRNTMGKDGRKAYAESSASEDSDAHDSNNSDSDCDELLGQDLVVSKVTNSQQPVARKQGRTIGNGLKLLAQQLIQVSLASNVKFQLAISLTDSTAWKSGSPLTPLIDCRGVTQEEIQVKLIARGFTEGFTLTRHHTGNIALDLRCGRQRPERCKYKVFVVYDSGAGMWIVDRIANEHNHDSNLAGIGAAVMGGARRLSGDGVEEEGDVGVDQNRLGGEGSVGRSVSRLTTLERPALIVASGGASSGKKRAREEETVVGSGSNYNPRVVNTKGSNVAGLMLPPPKRSSHPADASASVDRKEPSRRNTPSDRRLSVVSLLRHPTPPPPPRPPLVPRTPFLPLLDLGQSNWLASSPS